MHTPTKTVIIIKIMRLIRSAPFLIITFGEAGVITLTQTLDGRVNFEAP